MRPRVEQKGAWLHIDLVNGERLVLSIPAALDLGNALNDWFGKALEATQERRRKAREEADRHPTN